MVEDGREGVSGWVGREIEGRRWRRKVGLRKAVLVVVGGDSHGAYVRFKRDADGADDDDDANRDQTVLVAPVAGTMSGALRGLVRL